MFIIALPGIYADESSPSSEHHTFSFHFENDAFVSNDVQYTNGLKLIWSSYGMSKLPEDARFHKWLYPLIKGINFYNSSEFKKALTFSIGQNIYTPDDIKTAGVIKDDRPYAGITYVEFGFHKRNTLYMHTLELCAGIVGPHSYAEEVQSSVHSLLNTNEPEGWDNQLEDEPVLCLVYDYKTKLVATGVNSGFGGDLIFNTGGSLGNAATFYKAGLLTRYGWNVPDDFGNFPIQSATCFNAELGDTGYYKRKNRIGMHMFFSATTKAVLRDIFLDGNTFRDSHSVDKKFIVAAFSCGVGIISGGFKTTISYVHQTKLFDSQKKPQKFVTFNVSFQY